jgi:hypothetical protein
VALLDWRIVAIVYSLARKKEKPLMVFFMQIAYYYSASGFEQDIMAMVSTTLQERR